MRGSLSPTEDPYRTLQVEPSADLEKIKAAYRRLARLYHPDLNPRPEAAERMRAINAAYRVLCDPQQRAAYDAQRYLRAPTSTVVVRSPTRPRVRPVVVPAYEPPTTLQRRVDRVVAVLGILLLILIGLYAAFLIPRSDGGQIDRRTAGLTAGGGLRRRIRRPSREPSRPTVSHAARISRT